MKRDLNKAFGHGQIPVAAARLWQAEPQSVQFLARNWSLVYRFSTRSGLDRVLRMTHESHRRSRQVAAELDYVAYLSAHGLEVIRPVTSRNDQWFEVIETPLGRFTASCFVYVAGAVQSAPWRADPETHRLDFHKLGCFIGRLHRLAKKYRPNGPRRLRWDDERLASDRGMARYLFQPAIRSEHRLLLDWLRRQDETVDRFGLVHADITINNLVVEGDALQLFDFDNCCYHWYLYDLCGPLMSAAGASKSGRRRALDALLEGYSTEEPLPPFWIEDINMFWRWRSLDRYVTLMQREEKALNSPWQENRRQTEPFPISCLTPWSQNHMAGLRRQMFGRCDW